MGLGNKGKLLILIWLTGVQSGISGWYNGSTSIALESGPDHIKRLQIRELFEHSNTSSPTILSATEAAISSSLAEGMFGSGAMTLLEEVSTAEGVASTEGVPRSKDVSSTERDPKLKDVSSTERDPKLKNVSSTERDLKLKKVSSTEGESAMEGVSNLGKKSATKGVFTTERVFRPKEVSTTERVSRPGSIPTRDEEVTSAIRAQAKERNTTYFWVDSLLEIMSLEEKIGQLLMLPVYSDKKEAYYKDVEFLISRYHIGGLIFFQGSPTRQAVLTNRLQAHSKIPLFIGMDAEWGLAMRLDSLTPLPRNMTLGAIEDNRIIYNVGAEIARQCRLLGVHLNFAPVLDVNNNANNPVINVRSFGEDPMLVTEKGMALADGLQDNGIIAVGKHFPGHGDTETDSHYGLPLIRHDTHRLESIELTPFEHAIRAGLKGIMVAHLNVPSLEPEDGLPASLSKNIIDNLLIEDLGFSNLIFTDAMNMRGVTNTFPEGRRELEAFMAGNDVIVMPVNVPAVFESFRSAIRNHVITEEELSERVRKILRFKYEAGLSFEKEVSYHRLTERLNKKADDINYKVFENAITLLKSSNNLIPFHLVDTIEFASLALYGEDESFFNHIADRYAEIDHFSLPRRKLSEEAYGNLLEELSSYEVVLINVHDLNNISRRAYGLDLRDKQFIEALNALTNVVVTVFGTPYSLRFFEQSDVLLCAYEDNRYAQETAAQQLFGALPLLGKLPVSASSELKAGSGIHTAGLGRLGYSSPEREQFNVHTLSFIDTIIHHAIDESMIPGAQLLIARNGRIVLEKNYGYLTYAAQQPVSSMTLYDLASVTKVAGTLQVLMMLVDHGFIDLDKKISYYLPDLKNSNKEDMILRDILSHQAGLLPYYPFWARTTNDKNGDHPYYSPSYNAVYNVEVTPELFVRPVLKDTLWNWMIQSELVEKEDPLKPYEYLYSDIGFYIIQQLIERITGTDLDHFLREYLFTPMGLNNIGYLPRKKFPIEQIAPTEVDNTFRKGVIRGNVHDEIASIYGGIAGHAGLFSNAYSLAAILQMNLQGGYYGGVQYIDPGILNEFTRRQYKYNRRGLGWDKPQIIGHEYNPASFYASGDSYGHSGFTGTYVWVDPAYNLIYIFLSNRTFPDAGNKQLIEQEVRKRIQTVIYSSLINN